MSFQKDKKTMQFPMTIINDLYLSNKIFLNPFYQRQAVWNKYQKQLLMDSILHDVDIPKLYFRKVNKDGYEYEVVDGQQRVRAMVAFLSNEFDLSEDCESVDGAKVEKLSYKELPTDVQTKLKLAQFDTVVLNSAYTDDDIEEMFERLQNGTPLNAAERRRAYHSNMKLVVADLAQHKVFKLCGFTNKRYAHEDAVAKILHIFIHGTITDIKPSSIKNTYLANKKIDMSDKNVKDVDESFNFLVKAFDGLPSPDFKKYAIITLAFLVHEMIGKYDIKSHVKELGPAYLSFEQKRVVDGELPEGTSDPILDSYYNASRSDSIPDMKFRHEVLRDEIIKNIPDLEFLDPSRSFSAEQRNAVYWRDEGICKVCGKKVSENEFQVDHVMPHSKSGKTTLTNAQLICPSCNAKKKDKT